MRVGIGAVLGTTGGPVRYAQELVRALGAAAGDDEYVVFTNRPDLFPAGRRVHSVEVPLRSPLLEPLWEHVFLPAAARPYELDIYHGIKGALPVYLPVRKVVTIHDLAVYAHPGTFAWRQHLHMRPHLRLAARSADRIIADSEHARADIVQRLGVPASRVVTVPLGVRDDLFRPQAGEDDEEVATRLRLPERFLLYAGTVQPRKNVDLLIEAFRSLGLAPEWSLLIVGRLRPDYRPPWVETPPPGVRYAGVVADRDLAVIYRRATALISPSSHEGFGLTLLEAMASGCPVVGGNNTSVPEVVGAAGILLDRIDLDTVAEAMMRLVKDSALRAELSRRGRVRAERLTWTESARQMRQAYEELLNRD